MAEIIIYGAYGYTGRLIVEEAKAQNLDILLSGRSEPQLKDLSDETGYPYKAVDLNQKQQLTELLTPAKVVIHCAGPFRHTAQAMAEACLASNTHYLDITGEYEVFELLKSYDKQAAEKNLMFLPGAGFDVVPSDCLAMNLKNKLPSATHLTLAFASTGGGLSRGTSKTMVEGAGEGQIYRADHQLRKKAQGSAVKTIDYGSFEKISVGISWGDIVSAYYSTGIPNIEVFTGSSEKQIKSLKWAHRLRFFLKLNWVQKLIKKKIDEKPAGPSKEKREKSDTYLWGKVDDGNKSVEARLKTPNGYSLTHQTAILFAKNILKDDFKSGFQTPSLAYGQDVILQIPGCEYIG